MAETLMELVARVILDDSAFKSGLNAVQNQAKSAGNSIINTFGNIGEKAKAAFGKAQAASETLSKVVLGVGASGVAAMSALVLKGGFERAMAIENAQAKLKGLGHDTKTIETIMNNALASVKGTAYGLGDAASLAAQIVASGIKPGKELEQVLKTVADTSAIAGTSLVDMGMIFAKVAATGKLQGIELTQLMKSGLPVLDMLAKNTKVAELAMKEYGDNSIESIRNLVSDGMISFELFEESMRQNMGGAALETGNTFQGAMANIGAALSRVGEKIATPIMQWATAMSKDLIPAIDGTIEAVEQVVSNIIDFLKNSNMVTPVLYAIGGAIAIAVIPGLLGMAAGAVAAMLPLTPLIAAGAALAAIFYGIQNTSGAAKVGLITLGVVVGTFTTAMIAFTIASKAAAIAEAAKNAVLTVSTTATQVATAAQWLWNAALSANPIGIVIVAIAALVAAFILLWNNCEGFRNFFIDMWDKVKLAVQEGINFIIEWFNKIVDFIKDNWQALLLMIVNPFAGAFKLLYDNCEGFKNFIDNFVSNIKTFFTNLGTSISNIFINIKNTIINVWNSIKTTTINIWNGIKDAIMTPINWVKDKVKGIIDTIKGFFNFKISWPKIPMPHFNLKPSGWKIGDLLQGSIPSLGIDWYAKGGVLNSPTVFGINPYNNNLMIGGEAGEEAVAPIDVLQGYVRQAVAEGNNSGGIYDILSSLYGLLSEYLPALAQRQLVLDSGALVGELSPQIDYNLGNFNALKVRGNA